MRKVSKWARALMVYILCVAITFTMTPVNLIAWGADETNQQTEQAQEATSEDVQQDGQNAEQFGENDQTSSDESEDQAEEPTAEEAVEEEPASEEVKSADDKQSLEEKDPEATTADPENAATEETAEEETYKKGILSYDGKGYRITVSYGSEAEIPEGASLSVKEITSSSAKFEDYKDEAATAAGFSDEKDEKVKARFFDIKIKADGKEIEPEKSVKVKISFTDPLDNSDNSELETVHFGKKGAEKVETDNIGTSGKDGEVNAVSFAADSFSVYGVIYTVDFTYDGFTYSITGESAIKLSELVEILGIAGKGKDYTSGRSFVREVEEVSFTDESLVKVSKSGGNWILKSLQPFSSTETLTITMKDGDKYVVDVTDNQVSSNLVDFLTNAVITGATQDSEGRYEVEAGKEYNIILSFAESSAHQFDNHANLKYTMPDGLTILSRQTGDLKINIVYKGRTYQVDATYDLDTNGNLEIKFDENDPDFHHLENSTNVSFRFSYNGAFDESNDKIHFSEDIERDVIFDEPEPGQAYVTKNGTFDEQTGKFNYTITVKATGDITNVNVKDVISGNALIFNNDVRVSGNSSSYRDNGATNGFDYTFASMREGEVITITYSASVDFSKDTDKDGKITVDQTKNTATVKPEGGEPHTSEYSHEIAFKTTKKSNGTPDGTTADGDKIYKWTITYNELMLASAGGDTIKDTIAAGSTEYMKYYGDGLSIKVTDKNGNVVDTRTVPYSSLQSYSDSSWTYKIPEGDSQPYMYEITYYTVVDMEKVEGTGNTVTVTNDANGSSGSADVTPESVISVTKSVDSFTTEQVNWTVMLGIPEKGLTQAVVTDTFPAIWLNGKNIYDLLKDGSLQITGLLDGESYTVENVGQGQVKITFYQDTGKSITGLKATPGGHTITVKLTTLVDQEWLQKGYETGGYEQSHTNSVDFNGKTDTATVTFGKPGIEKKGDALKDSEGNITGLKYTVVLKGVSETPVSVLDTFDTSILEVDTSKASSWDHMRIWGGNQWSQDAGRMPVSYTDTGNGIILTADTVPMQTDGSYYPYYKIIYYLKVKDGVDLKALAIANGGEYDVDNTVKWGDHESEFTYTVEYDYLSKELLNAGELGGTSRTAKYQITFNPSKATLNEGEDMTMTDVLSANLSVDYGSIKIVTDPAGQNVAYSLSGGEGGTTVATYTIPDSTKVTITYDANVRGNGSQTIVNKVSVNGKKETVENTKSYGSASEGEGAQASFKIVKVDGYDANKKLQGVRFKIFCENPDVAFNEDGDLKEIILTTDENGEITLDGEQYTFYFDECYHVQEMEAPEDYGTIGFDYLVTLTNDMSKVDYGQYIYYFSDSMQIKNWPLEGLVVEKQVESDDLDDQEAYYSFRISVLNDDGSVNTDFNGKNGDDQFVNGVTEFQLKAGEQKMFWGFAKGTKYKVEEVDAEGFVTTVKYSVYDEDGNVKGVKTETTTEHTGVLTQEDETIVFKNKKTSKGEGEIKVQKVLNGRKWTDNDEFTFTLSAADGTPMPAERSITIKKSDADQTKSFGKIKFTKEGTYTYTVKETTPDGSGIDCDNSDHTVTIEVVKNDKGELVAKDGGSLIKTETITNTYKAEGQALFSAKKAGDATLGERTFTFQLLDADKKPIETSQPVKQGEKVDFTAIKYDLNKLGDHTYYIKEVIPEDATEENEYTVDGVTYDPSVKTVNVNVTDNKKGSLIVTYDGKDTFETPEFKNSYAAKGEGEVLVQKVLKGRDWTTDDKFEFTITPVDGAPAFKTNTKTVTSSSKDYTESFGKVEFTKAGTYQWEVTEKNKGKTIDGVAYDSADKLVTIVVKDDGKGNLVPETGSALVQTATFTNTYSESGEGEIKVQKNLEGRKWETTDSFKFTITPVDGAPKLEKDEVTVTSGSESYTESFGKVKFTKAGTYQWTVTEEHQGQVIDGIKYVSEPKTVTIVVKKDGKGQLVPETGSALVQTAEFTNEYSAKGEGEVLVQKELKGRKWTDNDSFTFEISAADGTPMPAATSIDITKADKDQTKSFGKIEFTKAGTYIYTVKETTQSGNGITCDTTEHTITIEVVDNGKGKLVANEGDSLIKTEKITNTYKAEGQALFSAKKAGDATLGERTFTFQLLDADKNPIETSQPVKQGEKVDFTAIKYDLSKLGDHTYYIKEVIPEDATAENKYTVDGVTYDTHVEKVTVKVSDNGDGTLGVTYNGKKDFETPAFTNSYAAKGEGEVLVKKTLEGRKWTTDDKFEFTITPEGDAPAFKTNTKTVTSSTKDYTESFGKVEFTKAGTYQWKVTEKHKGETIDGVAYDSADKLVTIVVKDDGKGKLVPETGSALVQTASFTNTYSKSGEGEIKVQKNLKGRKWETDDSFKFTITPVDGAPKLEKDEVTVTSGSESYTESFGKVKFTEAGTYKWTVTEEHQGEVIDGIKYVSEPKTVTIVVKDDGKGGLIPETGSALVQTAEFTNEYSAKGEGEVLVQKVLNGREWTDDDSFTFQISAEEGTPMPAETSIDIAKADKEQTKSFGKIEFTKAGTYTYTVKETTKDGDGIDCDTTEHTVIIEVVDNGKGKLVAKEGDTLIKTEKITNTYSAKGEGEVLVQKELKGRDWTDDDSFTFQISAAEGTPMPANKSITITKSDKNQTKSFGEIKFTKAGTYTYTVKETKGSIGGITYDETEHKVTIDVVDNGKGKLVADKGSAVVQTVEFINTYEAGLTKGEIKVQKILEGRKWTDDDEFEFTLSAPAGTPMPEEDTITITKDDKDQTVSFGQIVFDEPGKYTYTVKETKGDIKGVTYDTKKHKVTIEVVDDGNGKLVAEEGDSLIKTEKVTNTYAAKGEGEIKVQKVLNGRKWTDNDEFTFTLSAADGTPMPAERSITIKKSDADQTKSFGKIVFDEPGKYTYTVKETKGDIKGVTYDTKKHKVTIEVVDDGKGNLVAKDGTKLIQTVKITNTAHKGVKTGDDSNVILYSTTMLGSILAFLFMAIRRRRNRA